MLEQLEGKIAEIGNITEEPSGTWINKRRGVIDFTEGEYEFVMQSGSGELRLYSIEVSKEGASRVDLRWTIS